MTIHVLVCLTSDHCVEPRVVCRGSVCRYGVAQVDALRLFNVREMPEVGWLLLGVCVGAATAARVFGEDTHLPGVTLWWKRPLRGGAVCDPSMMTQH